MGEGSEEDEEDEESPQIPEELQQEELEAHAAFVSAKTRMNNA